MTENRFAIHFKNGSYIESPATKQSSRGARAMAAVPYQFLEDVSAFPYPDPDDTVLDFVPTGWTPAFLRTCGQIQEVFDELRVSSIHFRFEQVKEKYGALRIYWHIDSDCVDDIDWAVLNEACDVLIDDLENETADLCIGCGAPATRHSTGWVMPFCDACATRCNAEQNARHKTTVSVDAAYPRRKPSGELP